MMPFSLGVCLGHRPLAFVVTSHIIECTPATSWHVYTSHKLACVHQPQAGMCTPATSWHVYTSHKLASVYTSHKLASVYTSHEGECGATCQKMAGGHCPSLFRYSTPLKPPSVFSNRIPYSNKPSVCAQNSLVIFKKAPTPGQRKEGTASVWCRSSGACDAECSGRAQQTLFLFQFGSNVSSRSPKGRITVNFPSRKSKNT